MTTDQRIAKFVRQAPKITTQEHLDRIMASFAPEDRKLACESVRGILSAKLVAQEDVQVEVKARVEGQPNVAEETVMRLNQQAAKIIEQADTMAEMDKTIRSKDAEIVALQKREAELMAVIARGKP